MRAPPLGGQTLLVFVSFRAFLTTPSVPGTRDRGASQYLKTADSLAAKHLIGPAQSDLCGFFVVRGTRWGKTADGIAGGDLLARRENFGAVALGAHDETLPAGVPPVRGPYSRGYRRRRLKSRVAIPLAAPSRVRLPAGRMTAGPNSARLGLALPVIERSAAGPEHAD